ncbi:MAG: hypothetical protein J1E34_04415 [Oscillospiraceae bacterium]|nr:hypothetical protein [Oscillospiraceae bacterium]
MQSKKKILLTSLIVMLMAVLFMFSASANVLGDVDGDNKITAADARLALRASVKLENYAPGSAKFLACDVDYDNSITAADARLILRAAVGLENIVEKPSKPEPEPDKPEHVHQWSAEWTAEKNSKGVVTGKHIKTCKGCNEVQKKDCSYGENIYDTSNTKPTCTANVRYHNTCSVCGGNKISTIAALNHKNAYIDKSRGKAPNCIEGGYEIKYCPDCGVYGKKDGNKLEKSFYTALPPVGNHENAYIDASRSKAPTCTEGGYDVKYCPDCGTYGKANGTELEKSFYTVIPPTGKHEDNPAVYESKDPTCTEGGYKIMSCSICGTIGKADGTEMEKLLYIVLDPLGHTVDPNVMPVEDDSICGRCGTYFSISFNNLVNSLKTSDLQVSTLTKNESFGTLRKFDLNIPAWLQALMRLEGVTKDDIKREFTAELSKNDTSYSDYHYTAQPVNSVKNFPLPGQDIISALKESDVKSVTVEENLTSVDFIEEIPDEADIQLTENSHYRVSLKFFKELVTSDANITKITVITKSEKYSEFKNSENETALMRTTGLDIRDLFTAFNAKEEDDGFTLDMTCREMTSECTVNYYFVVTEDENGEKVYTPIAARYLTALTVDQHIALSLDLEEREGLMTGDIDLTLSNNIVNYYIFSTEK